MAELVLLDGRFAHLPDAVAEGRRVIANIERAASLFLIKNVYSLVLAVITVITLVAYPLAPVQLTLISTVTIGIPGFFLALGPNRRRYRRASSTGCSPSPSGRADHRGRRLRRLRHRPLARAGHRGGGCADHRDAGGDRRRAVDTGRHRPPAAAVAAGARWPGWPASSSWCWRCRGWPRTCSSSRSTTTGLRVAAVLGAAGALLVEVVDRTGQGSRPTASAGTKA